MGLSGGSGEEALLGVGEGADLFDEGVDGAGGRLLADDGLLDLCPGGPSPGSAKKLKQEKKGKKEGRAHAMGAMNEWRFIVVTSSPVHHSLW